MKPILLVTNAAAGTNDEDALDAALEVLRKQTPVEVVATADADELDEALRHRGGRDVVIAGGDGSLHALVAALDRLGDLGGRDAPVLGLVPLGTGNDFAGTLGIPADPAQAAEVIIAGAVSDTDLLRDDAGAVCVNVAHVGIGAEAGRAAKPWKERLGTVGLGVLGYAIGSVLAMAESPGWKLAITADGRQVASGSRRVIQVAVANGRTIGGGAEIAPDAAAEDGLADVTVSYAVGRFARIRYGFHMPRGTHTDHADVETLRAREVSIVATGGKTFLVNTDGELSAPVTARTWRVEPSAYRMWTPGIA